MARVLARTVLVRHPESRELVRLARDTTPPADLADLVPDHAWGAAGRPSPPVAEAPADFEGVALADLVDYARGREVDVPSDADGPTVLALLKGNDQETSELLQTAAQQLQEAHERAAALEGNQEPTGAPPAPAPAGDGSQEPLVPSLPAEIDGKGVEEVNAWLDAHPERVEEVLEAEAAAAKPRKGITEGPHAPRSG